MTDRDYDTWIAAYRQHAVINAEWQLEQAFAAGRAAEREACARLAGERSTQLAYFLRQMAESLRAHSEQPYEVRDIAMSLVRKAADLLRGQDGPPYVVACPECRSRDEYNQPDPPEHTCGHFTNPHVARRITQLENALHAYAPDHDLLRGQDPDTVTRDTGRTTDG